ncbi:MAG: deaminase [Alphaproteobacteria bacterium]
MKKKSPAKKPPRRAAKGPLMKDRQWLELAARAAVLSPHPSVKVGAVITSPGAKDLIAAAVNEPPDGVALLPARFKHGEKSLWFMCAEKRALALAQERRAEFGLKNLKGCRIYSTLPPCHTCAHDIIQAGVRWVCVPEGALRYYPKLKKKYRRSMEAAAEMFAERGVRVHALR